ncbi:MAG: transpeptidase family protein [Bacteroidales bacterium]|nr:transpeptidase family protein [Bacteroidales bacterium]
MKADPKTETLLKTYLVYILVLVFGVAIIAKIILVQTKDNKELLERAEQREYRVRTLEASRGNIFSADGQLMAISIPLYDVFFDYKAVDSVFLAENIDSLCRQMAGLFPKRNAAQWKAFFAEGKAKKNRHYRIALNITQTELRQMEQFVIFNRGIYKGGIITEKKIRRDHPYKELASLMLGMANEEKGYYFGIEGAYNDFLKGQNGKQLVRRIHHGDWMPVNSEDDIDAKNGDDVYTTFDIKLQDVVESALNNTLVTNKAEQGCAILMDVETGYVKALANLRLNHETGVYEESYNVALTERYEPGSVFKIASMVVLLNHKENTQLTDLVNIGTGPIKFSNRTMKDDHSFAKGGICTVQEVIEQSSNKGTAVLITKNFAAHPEKYVEGLYALGLNKKIGTGIKGEAEPVIKHPDDKTKDGRKLWSNVSLPWMSIGYEVNVTPMQLLMLYNAIANGGRMMKPQFVTEIRRGNQTIEKYDPIVLNEHIASPESIEKLQTMLEGVAIRGTAKRQFADCIVNVAGKTGTAQYYDKVQGYAYHEPGLGRKLYNTTFVGYFPADKPRYSCIVMVSRARGAKWAAGGVSAPGFREIAEKVYAMRIGVQEDDSLTITPEYGMGPVLARHEKEANYLNGIAKNYNDFAINGDWVTVESNESGQISIREAQLANNIVPNVVGMDITDAVYLLENMGIRTEFAGQGTVKEQSLHPGDTLKTNPVIHLKLEKK